MSLGPDWFAKSAVEERRKRYPKFTADQWAGVLEEFYSTIQPVAEEAAEWLKENMSSETIYEKFGYSILHLYAEVTKDTRARNLAASIRESAECCLLEARNYAKAVGAEDPDIENLRSELAEAKQDKVTVQSELRTQLDIRQKRDEESNKRQIKSDAKAAIREIELRCRWLVGGLYVGAIGVALAIAFWLGSISYSAPIEIEGAITRTVTLAAVLLPIPLVFLCVWVEGRLSEKYVYRAAMGEYRGN